MLEWRMNKQGGGERVTKGERWESWQGRGSKFSVENTEGTDICQPVQVFPAGILPNCYSSLCIIPFF